MNFNLFLLVTSIGFLVLGFRQRLPPYSLTPTYVFLRYTKYGSILYGVLGLLSALRLIFLSWRR